MKTKRSREALQCVPHGFATTASALIPKPTETAGPPVPALKMDVIPTILVPHPVTVAMEVSGATATQPSTSRTMSPAGSTSLVSTPRPGIGGMIPTVIPTSIPQDSSQPGGAAQQPAGLKSGSVDPFVGVNLPDLDLFNVDPNSIPVDTSFENIPLPPGTSIDDALLDLDSMDTSPFKDFLESDFPNPRVVRSDGHQGEQKTTVTVQVPQSCSYSIGVCGSETSPNSPAIPASRVVPRAKALAAANANLEQAPTATAIDTPRRGRPPKVPKAASGVGATSYPIYQKRGRGGRFQKKYERVPLPQVPPEPYLSSGGSTTDEEK